MNSTNVSATYEAALLAPASTQPQGSQLDKIANAVNEALAPDEHPIEKRGMQGRNAMLREGQKIHCNVTRPIVELVTIFYSRNI